MSLVRLAAKRVVARQASVPRPWLGVKGEPVVAVTIERIVDIGWEVERARELALKRQGILLTSVAPGSPAALAKLKAGGNSQRNKDLFEKQRSSPGSGRGKSGQVLFVEWPALEKEVSEGDGDQAERIAGSFLGAANDGKQMTKAFRRRPCGVRNRNSGTKAASRIGFGFDGRTPGSFCSAFDRCLQGRT